MTPKSIKELLVMPERPTDAHKGSCGRVLVVAGSRGMTGAAALTAEAALRIGAGIVTLACPATLQDIFAVKLTSVMTLAVADTGFGRMSSDGADQLIEQAGGFDVLAIGPGIGRDTSTQELVLRLLGEVDKPMVVDADGLFALAGGIEVLGKRKPQTTILTPHLGEMSRLSGHSVEQLQTRRNENGIEYAKHNQCILILKGPGTLVTDGEHAFENTSGGSELATAGSGDVLTGFIVGLAAQGVPLIQSAVLGVHLHGLCGRFGAEQWTKFGLISSDLIKYLPQAIRELNGNV